MKNIASISLGFTVLIGGIAPAEAGGIIIRSGRTYGLTRSVPSRLVVQPRIDYSHSVRSTNPYEGFATIPVLPLRRKRIIRHYEPILPARERTIRDSILIEPKIINSRVRDSVLVNPVIITPSIRRIYPHRGVEVIINP